MSKKKILLIFGTRPEAIKMAPVVMELRKHPDKFEPIVCVSAQHRQMLDQVLELFEIKPDFDLNIMKENQNLWGLTSDILLQTKDIIEETKPDAVLVHGDTTTALAASLSAFYAKVPIGHVEAGLRTFDKYYPFPEEINRVIADGVSSFHFAPTKEAVNNLKKSAIPTKNIVLTGNTVIDALLFTVQNKPSDLSHLNLDKSLKTILMTSHRRENFGKPLEDICDAILELIEKNADTQVIYPVHLNPNVRSVVFNKLGGQERIRLIEPMDYAPFVTMMNFADIILTDSGGIQEEAPSLKKPVLVLRDTTERPEALKSGAVKLVGTNKEKIVKETQKLLDSSRHYKKMLSSKNPYGDGKASERIIKFLSDKL